MTFVLLVAVSETSELLLSSGVPHIELDWTVVGVENHWVDFNTESCNVLLLELSSQMALDESGLSDTTVSDKHELVFSKGLGLSFHL
jgi:hypothetical protein